MKQRLSQILFSQGFGTRRLCTGLVWNGEVAVNGKEAPYTNAADFTRAITADATAAGYPAANDPAKVKVSGFFSALGSGQSLRIIAVGW